MREDALEDEAQLIDAAGDGDGVLGRAADAPHAGVNGQMDVDPPHVARDPGHEDGAGAVDDGGGDARGELLGELLGEGVRQLEDRQRDAGVPQFDALGNGGDAEPVDETTALQDVRDVDGAVAVGVRLDRGEDLAAAGPLAQGARVHGEGVEVDLGVGRVEHVLMVSPPVPGPAPRPHPHRVRTADRKDTGQGNQAERLRGSGAKTPGSFRGPTSPAGEASPVTR